jgi:hypothetical protein
MESDAIETAHASELRRAFPGGVTPKIEDHQVTSEVGTIPAAFGLIFSGRRRFETKELE